MTTHIRATTFLPSVEVANGLHQGLTMFWGSEKGKFIQYRGMTRKETDDGQQEVEFRFSVEEPATLRDIETIFEARDEVDVVMIKVTSAQ